MPYGRLSALLLATVLSNGCVKHNAVTESPEALEAVILGAVGSGDWNRIDGLVDKHYQHDGFPSGWLHTWIEHLRTYCASRFDGRMEITDRSLSPEKISWSYSLDMVCEGPQVGSVTVLHHASRRGFLGEWCRRGDAGWRLCGNGLKGLFLPAAVSGEVEGSLELLASETALTIWKEKLPRPELLDFALFFGQNLLLPYDVPGDTWGGIILSDGEPIGVETTVLPTGKEGERHTRTAVKTAPHHLRIKSIDRWWDPSHNLVRADVETAEGAHEVVRLESGPAHGWLPAQILPYAVWKYRIPQGGIQLTLTRLTRK